MFAFYIYSFAYFVSTLLGTGFFFFFPFLNSFLMNVDFFLLAKDLKVWRTDPGSIFDLDPLEDNIQSRSLHMLSGITHFLVHPIYVVLSQK